jgi:phage N-6-adenine-methyltransferase
VQQLVFGKALRFQNQEPSWATPPEVFDLLDRAFGGFDLDVCALPHNAKCPAFISPEEDTLDPSVRWRGRCWMNPPYGDGIEAFLAKANREVERGGARVVALLPTNFESAWFRQHCQQWPFLVWPGRIKFIHPDGTRGERPANGNVVVAFGYTPEELPRISFYKKREGLLDLAWFTQVTVG